MIPRTKVAYRWRDLVAAALTTEATADHRPAVQARLRGLFGTPHVLLTPSGRAGMLYLLEEMDQNDPAFDGVLEVIEAAGRGLIPHQDAKTGLWRNVIDHPDARLESSGTAGFCYVYARCIREGWLDRDTFLPMVHRAWQGVKRMYWRQGLAANCRGSGASVDLHYYPPRIRELPLHLGADGAVGAAGHRGRGRRGAVSAVRAGLKRHQAPPDPRSPSEETRLHLHVGVRPNVLWTDEAPYVIRELDTRVSVAFID